MARGLCQVHYQRAKRAGTLERHPRKPARYGGLLGNADASWSGSAFVLFPSRPQRVVNALAALAETPGLTLAEYERRKTRILSNT